MKVFKVSKKESVFAPGTVYLKDTVSGADFLGRRELKGMVKSMMRESESFSTYSINSKGVLQVSAFILKKEDFTTNSKYFIPLTELIKVYLEGERFEGYAVFALSKYDTVMVYHNGILDSYDSNLKDEGDLVSSAKNAIKTLEVKGHSKIRVLTDRYFDPMDSEILDLEKVEIDLAPKARSHQKIKNPNATFFKGESGVGARLGWVFLRSVLSGSIIVIAAVVGFFLTKDEANKVFKDLELSHKNIEQIKLSAEEEAKLLKSLEQDLSSMRLELKRELKKITKELEGVTRELEDKALGEKASAREEKRIELPKDIKLPGVTSEGVKAPEPVKEPRNKNVSADIPKVEVVLVGHKSVTVSVAEKESIKPVVNRVDPVLLNEKETRGIGPIKPKKPAVPDVWQPATKNTVVKKFRVAFGGATYIGNGWALELKENSNYLTLFNNESGVQERIYLDGSRR